MAHATNTGITQKHQAELEFWRGMVAELTRDCTTPEDAEAALLRVSHEKTFPRYKHSLYLTDEAFQGLRILDVGCGPHCGIIGFTDCEKHGIDPLINEYRKLGYPLDKYGVQFACAGSEQMPYDNETFDVVLCVNALDHVDNLSATVHEMARVLKMGGRFIGQINFHSYATECEPIMLNDEVIRTVLCENGLRVTKQHFQCSVKGMTEDRYYYEAEKVAVPMEKKAPSLLQKLNPLARVQERPNPLCAPINEGEWKLQEDKYILFRLVPTMRCNYRCAYCFLGDEGKAGKETMFDLHPPEDWISALQQYKDYTIEFYAWGGEPFVLNGTYELVKGWCACDFVGGGNRIDTNMAFTDKIAERCPTDKVKLNCSWHTQYDSLDSIYAKVQKLHKLGMVGMVNFVASLSNMQVLTHEYKMTLDDLVDKFAQIGVYLNVAADFGIVHDHSTDPRTIATYQKMILRYVSLEEWRQQRGEAPQVPCVANKHFYTLHPNGDIRPCLGDSTCGNFFEGTLTPPESMPCPMPCLSLVSYPFKIDNPFPYRQHLLAYVERSMQHRAQVRLQESYSGDPIPSWDAILERMQQFTKC